MIECAPQTFCTPGHARTSLLWTVIASLGAVATFGGKFVALLCTWALVLGLSNILVLVVPGLANGCPFPVSDCPGVVRTFLCVLAGGWWVGFDPLVTASAGRSCSGPVCPRISSLGAFWSTAMCCQSRKICGSCPKSASKLGARGRQSRRANREPSLSQCYFRVGASHGCALCSAFAIPRSTKLSS